MEKMGEYAHFDTDPEVTQHRPAGGLELVTESQPEVYSKPESDEKRYFYNHDNSMSHRRRVCGVTPLVFWILILISVVLLAAGLGAGLGAGLSKSRSEDKAGYITLSHQ